MSHNIKTQSSQIFLFGEMFEIIQAIYNDFSIELKVFFERIIR